MIKYLVIHGLLSFAILALLRVMRTAPPRLRLYIAVLGVFIWAIPIPRFSVPVSLPEQVATVAVYVYGETESLPDGVAQSGSPVGEARGMSSLPFWLLFFAVGVGLWLRAVGEHHKKVKNLDRVARNGNYLWDNLDIEGSADLLLIPGNGAMTTGFLHPVIWIGEDHLANEELRTIILHELTHIRHRDNVLIFLLHIWERLFWWNPVLQILGRRARFYIELSCDQACQRQLGLDQYKQVLARMMLNNALHRQGGYLTAQLVSDRKENIDRLKEMRSIYPMRKRFVLALSFFMVFGTAVVTVPENRTLRTAIGLEKVPRVGALGVDPPIFLDKVMPVYPPKAIEISLQGYVILEAVFYRDGRVGDLKVLHGLGDGKLGFETAAMAAVGNWRFEPGRLDGMATDVRMSLKIDFILTEDYQWVVPISWQALDGEQVDLYPPTARVDRIYRRNMANGPVMNLPVNIDLDAYGEVVRYAIDERVLTQVAYPELIREKVARGLDRHRFTVARLEGNGVPTQMKINVSIPLD